MVDVLKGGDEGEKERRRNKRWIVKDLGNRKPKSE